jgi:hypothetical protein
MRNYDPESPAAVKRGVGSTPHRWLATRQGRGQVPAPQYRPVGSTRLPTGYDSDNLPAGAIGNDFRESQHPALAAPFRAARSPFHRTPDGMDRRNGHPVPGRIGFPISRGRDRLCQTSGHQFRRARPCRTAWGAGPTSDKPKPGDPDQLAAHDRRPRTRKLEWMERTLGVPPTNDGIDLDRALTHPAATFDEPERVVRHPQLSPEQKRDVLRRWALEACRTDGARTQAFAQSDSARLDKVIDALIDLDEPGGLVVIKRKDTGSAAVHVGPATPLAGHEHVRNAGGRNDGAEMERIRC